MCGSVRQARYGEVRSGTVSWGVVWQAGQGKVWKGRLGRVKVGQGLAV